MAQITHLTKVDATHYNVTSTSQVEVTAYTITWEDLVAAGFAAGDDVFLLVTAKIGNSSANSSTIVQVGHGTTYAGRTSWPESLMRQEPPSADTTGNEVYACQYGWFTRHTLVDQEDLYVSGAVDGNTGRFKKFFTLILKLDDIAGTSFAYASTNPSGNAPTTYTDGASLSLAAGDWLVFGHAHGLVDSTSADLLMRILSGASPLGERRSEGEAGTDEWSAFTMAYCSLASTTTVKMQYMSDTASASDVDETSIFALKLSAFKDYSGYQAANTISHTVVDTYQEFAGFPSMSHSQTGPVVVFGWPLHVNGNQAHRPYGRIQIDGADFGGGAGYAVVDNGTSSRLAPMLTGYGNVTAGTRDWDFDIATYTVSGSFDCVEQTAVVFSTELASAASNQTITPSAVASAGAVPNVLATVVITLTPSPLASSAAIATPTVARGARTLSPNPVVSSAAIAGPSIVVGPVTITPNPVTSASVSVAQVSISSTTVVAPTPVTSSGLGVASVTVVPGASVITVSPVASTAAVATPSVVVGVRTLTPSAVVSSTVVVPSVAASSGATIITPTPVTSAASVASVTWVQGSVTVSVNSVTSTKTAVPSVAIALGQVVLTPAPVTSSTQSVASVTVSTAKTLTPSPVTGSGAIPSITVVLGARTITPSAVSTAGAIPASSVALGVRTLTVNPVISSRTGVATVTVLTDGAISPQPVQGSPAVPAVTISVTGITLTPTPVVGAPQIGAVSVLRGGYTLVPGAVAASPGVPVVAVIRGASALLVDPVVGAPLVPAAAISTARTILPDPVTGLGAIPLVVVERGSVSVQPLSVTGVPAVPAVVRTGTRTLQVTPVTSPAIAVPAANAIIEIPTQSLSARGIEVLTTRTQSTGLDIGTRITVEIVSPSSDLEIP